MRLICPNCGAQYEVPGDVIPTSGRDVQCSNCSHTWFQMHPDQDAELAEELGQPIAASDWPEDVETQPAAQADDTAEAEHDPQPQPHDEPQQAPEPPYEPEPERDPETGSAAPADALWTEPDEDSPEPDRTAADPSGDDAQVGDLPADLPADLSVPDLYDDEDDAPWDDAPDAVIPPPATPATARQLDPAIAELLRAEAERETRQRAAESGTLESQPDLGLDAYGDPDMSRRQREAQERMARLRGEAAPGDAAQARARTAAPDPSDPSEGLNPDQLAALSAGDAAAVAAAAAAATRREMLPDIEEINSTLRATSERRPASADDHAQPAGAAPAPAPAQAARGGFGRGFVLMLALICVLLALYLAAPRIAAAVPALAPALESYAGAVDQGRIWLDDRLQGVLVWLDSMSSEAPPASE